MKRNGGNAKANTGKPAAGAVSLAGAARGRRNSKDKDKDKDKPPLAPQAGPSGVVAPQRKQPSIPGRGGGVRMSKGPSDSILLDMTDSSKSGSTSAGSTSADEAPTSRVPFKPGPKQKHPNSEEDTEDESFYHEQRIEVEAKAKPGDQTAKTSKTKAQSPPPKTQTPTKTQSQGPGSKTKPQGATGTNKPTTQAATLGKAKSATLVLKPPPPPPTTSSRPPPDPNAAAFLGFSDYDGGSEEEVDETSGDEDYPETDPDSDLENGHKQKLGAASKVAGKKVSQNAPTSPKSQTPPRTPVKDKAANVGAEPSHYSQAKSTKGPKAVNGQQGKETDSARHKAFDDDDSQTRFKLENYLAKHPEFLEEYVVNNVDPGTIQEWVCRAAETEQQGQRQSQNRRTSMNHDNGNGNGHQNTNQSHSGKAKRKSVDEGDEDVDEVIDEVIEDPSEPSNTSADRNEGNPKSKGPPATIQLMFDSDGVVKLMTPEKLAEFKEEHGIDLAELSCPMPAATIYTPRQNYFACNHERGSCNRQCPQPCPRPCPRGPQVNCQTRIPYYNTRQASAYCNQQAADMVQFQSLNVTTCPGRLVTRPPDCCPDPACRGGGRRGRF